ncbi:MAG: type II secretion system protein [Phycisphaerae bacterium]
MRSRHPSAFSLVELLVVVAIIGVLLAMVVPAMGRARAQSRQAACGSNLRQLGLAGNMYNNEWNGSYWPYFAVPPGANLASGRVWWFGQEGAVVNGQRHLDKSAGPLAGYTANLAKQLQCPDFPYTDPNFNAKFDQPAASYGYNAFLFGNDLFAGGLLRNTLKRVSYFGGRTSEVFMFADGIHDDFSDVAYNEGHYLQYQANPASRSGYAHFRHDGKAQVVFLDGHVEAMTRTTQVHPRTNDAGGLWANLASPDGSRRIYGYDQ